MDKRRIIVRIREGYALTEMLITNQATFKAKALGRFEQDENAKSHQDPFSIESDAPEKEYYNAPFYQKLGKMDKEIYRTFKIDCDNDDEFRKVMESCENQKDKAELFYEDGTIYLHTPPPNDPEFIKTQRKLYGQLGVEECWDFVKGANQIVGVIDTGVLTTHPDLAQNLWKKGDKVGYTYPNTQKMEDTFGHGTPVTGIIGGIGNNGVGIVGVAPEATVQMHKLFLRGNEDFMSEAKAAISIAKQDGIRIMNCSFGISSCSRGSTAEKDFQRYVNNLSGNMLFVFSSGNGTDNNLQAIDIKDTFLNELPDVLKVGALDSNNQRASYSNFGRDVVYAYGAIMSTNKENSYDMFHHTSAAAPQVSGICALLVNAFPYVPVQKIRNAVLKTKNPENNRVNAFSAFKLLQQQESVFV